MAQTDSPDLTGPFRDALLFAARLHAGQKRKGTGVPYISHLLGVASIALDYGADEHEAIAALLHDAVEDQGGRPVLQEIRRRFGEHVAEIVDGCTDSYEIPKPPWKARKEAYLGRLREISPSARFVSAADKLYNVQSILRDHRRAQEKVWERFSASPADVLWYYKSFARLCDLEADHPLIEELRRAVRELEALVAS